MDLSVRVYEKEGEFVASCPELDVYTYGVDAEEARRRLKHVIAFYASTAQDLGYKIDASELLSNLKAPAHTRSESFLN
ncbi:MAG TPA: type II toxin-antitoxin system HicB family antitoxin [Turneriella sp.]|nr:type II toxin-antitoxin system HicB family antitoxin [Turneriella sp.]